MVSKHVGEKDPLPVHSKTTTTTAKTTSQLLRNKKELSIDNASSNDQTKQNAIDLGVLEAAGPADETIEHNHRELSDYDYCLHLCGPEQYRQTVGPDIKSLLEFCDEKTNCGDCSGTERIDYRCPSQVKCWKTTYVTDMRNAFQGETDFNEPLRCWDVSSVTDMSRMFYRASSFNQPIDNWNVSSVTDMSSMFDFAYSFNQALNSWDVGSVTDMYLMFADADAFHQSLDSWDVSSVTRTVMMFTGSNVFNGEIGSWDVSSATDMYGMFAGARQFNQDIGDWDVSSNTDMKAMFGGSANDVGGSGIFNQNIDNWDVSSVTDMTGAFFGKTAFNQPLQSWDVSNVESFQTMFHKAIAFNQPLDLWQFSPDLNELSFLNMFDRASDFNQCLSSWDGKTSFQFPTNIPNTKIFDGTSCPEPYNSDSLCQGFYQQCYATSCTDDPNFRLNGVDSQGCEWVAAEDTANNCAKVGVFEACASTCNPVCFGGCFDDPKFRLEGVDSQDCEWVAAEDTVNRCAKEGVFEGCPNTCNPLCFGGCSDDPNFRLNGVNGKSCEWVAKQKTSERCAKPGVADACSQTCKGLCAVPTELDCTDDEDFMLGGLKAKNCEWVGKQKTDNRCKKPGVMASCRKTCNPACVCKDSEDVFEFDGQKITCDDLDVANCDEVPILPEKFSASELTQLQALIAEALEPIQETLDVLEDAVVENEEDSTRRTRRLSVEDEPTFNELCPKKCNSCPGT